MSLRGRFVAVSTAVALLTSGGAFSAVWVVYNATQERQLDAAVLAEAQENALGAAGAEPALTLVSGRGELEPASRYAAVYDSDGQAIRWTPNLTQARPRMDLIRHPFRAPFDLWWNNEHLRAVLLPVASDPGKSLFFATPRTDLDGDAGYLARRMVAALLIAVVVSAVATSWLARVLTRDHQRIATVARTVAAGDLSARIGALAGDREMVQLGRDVDEMIARLAVLVETQQRFIASASHELRSPVTALLGELSLALRRDRDAATYRESIEEALAAARRLKVVTEDLLALARVGGADLEVESVPLSGVTGAVLEATRGEAEAQGVAVEVACDGAVVEGHGRDLERLLRNLVENAIRHSPRGSTVRIEARADEEHARLEVSDEGPGVPESARERIFEPFFRLSASCSSHAGAGLGLAIGRSIARAHGGDLWVDASQSGARFVARLPVSRPAGA
jgi:two-component system heavy metal sensor histidine kinase CusS